MRSSKLIPSFTEINFSGSSFIHEKLNYFLLYFCLFYEKESLRASLHVYNHSINNCMIFLSVQMASSLKEEIEGSRAY